MSERSRTLLRIDQLVRRQASRLRRVPEVGLLVVAALVIGVIVFRTASGADWEDILRSQALNLVTAAILAGFAYLLFIARFRRAQQAAYLDRFRHGPSGRGSDRAPSDLVRTIVDELLDARPPLACLVVGPRETTRAQLLADIAAQLVTKGTAPVEVDVHDDTAGVGLPALIRDRYVGLLIGSTGDPQNGRRVYAALVRKRRLVALVRGLDRLAQGRSLIARRAEIAELLKTSVDEGIPFVACVEERLAPSISEVAAFRPPPLPAQALIQYFIEQLKHRRSTVDARLEEAIREGFSGGEPTRDPAFLDLAIDLLVRRVRSGEAGPAVVGELFAEKSAFRRQLGWMCEWALDCALEDVGRHTSPAALTLATVGVETHYREASELSVSDAVASLDVHSRRQFMSGLALLTQRGVVQLTEVGGAARLRFSHPGWLAFGGSIGLRLDGKRWADLLRPGTSAATLEALTFALLIFGREQRAERSFVRVLRKFAPGRRLEISLEMALAVIAALQEDPALLRIEEPELAVLERAWRVSNEPVRLKFIAEADFGSQRDLMTFLWSQVVPPEFGNNTFRVRRAICARLGSLGSPAWRPLRRPWTELVAGAAGMDLSSWSYREARSRHEPWTGSALASLAWVMPHLLLSVEDSDKADVYELLAGLREVVGLTTASSSGPRHADIGLEISLAEGFKAAADKATPDRSGCDARWRAEALNLLGSSRSWIGQQALLQALSLACPDLRREKIELGQRLRTWEASSDRHPFVRETAALLLRDLERPVEAMAERDIWLEPEEALDDGGVSLSAECHRLLGLSTLLIVMAERRFGDWAKGEEGATEDSVDARERAFTDPALPPCFQRRNYAATMLEADCECPFQFCGVEAKGPILKQQRRFSRSFVQRAQVTARRPTVSRNQGRSLFPDKAFGDTWRALDDELVAAERDASGVAP